MSVYDEIRDNMSTINNANPNHNYKYYMLVMGNSDDFISDYLDMEDFCKQHKIIVLDYYKNPLYNGDLYRNVANFVNNSLDIDLWDSLCRYCYCGERIFQKDYDKVEAEISYECDIDFSLEEFCHYLKVFGDENDDETLALTRFILSKKNDVIYRSTKIQGASQGDWVELYYPEGTDGEVFKVLKAALFDLGYEVYICPWNDTYDGGFAYIFVPYPSDEDCLEFAMNETGCKRDEVYIECFEEYEYIPKYRHLEFK